MPRITVIGPSNADEEVPTSAGISSSTSVSTQDKSGSTGTLVLPSPAPVAESRSGKGQPASLVQSSSVSSTDGSTQETGPGQLSLPASSGASAEATQAGADQGGEGPSEEEPASGGFLVPDPEPGAGRQPPQAPAANEAAARQAMVQARDEYDKSDWDAADEFLTLAETLDPGLSEEVMRARTAVRAGRYGTTTN